MVSPAQVPENMVIYDLIELCNIIWYTYWYGRFDVQCDTRD